MLKKESHIDNNPVWTPILLPTGHTVFACRVRSVDWVCGFFSVFKYFLDLRFRGRHFSPPLPPTLFPVPRPDARGDDPRRTIKLSHYLPCEFKLLIGTKPSSRSNSIASKKPTGSWTFDGRALLTLVQYRATAFPGSNHDNSYLSRATAALSWTPH